MWDYIENEWEIDRKSQRIVVLYGNGVQTQIGNVPLACTLLMEQLKPTVSFSLLCSLVTEIKITSYSSKQDINAHIHLIIMAKKQVCGDKFFFPSQIRTTFLYSRMYIT